jgi:ferredoxin
MDLDTIRSRIALHGLSYRGAFHPESPRPSGEREGPAQREGEGAASTASLHAQRYPRGDAPSPEVHPRSDLSPLGRGHDAGASYGTLVLVGFIGSANWPTFASSSEANDGQPDPLDRWSTRVITTVAQTLGATPLFPFGGPPFLPFQRWAQQAEPVHPSPLGILIHPDWGLWHAYRGALALAERIDLPPPDTRPSPCESCIGRPCLTACPVGAFTPAGYDAPACVAHISTPTGADCITTACRARRACPIGTDHRQTCEQAEFHQRAFLAAQRP